MNTSDPPVGPVGDELHSTDRVIRWASHPPIHIGETTLSTRETALIDFLRAEANQDLTPSEILSRSPLSGGETMAVLSGLIATGVLELGERSSAPEAKPEARDAQPFDPVPLPKKLGRFEVDRLLGRGSMGAVLLAKDPAIDRVVAIKLVQTAAHLTASQRDKYRERFYREASAAGQLLHPAIATVFDVGHTDDGTPFLVMEYVKGETLRELLENGKPTLAETLRIARDVLEALGFAHAQGIVHRDVKPSNIMVTSEGRAKIMDFGIAHVMGSELTAGGDLLGSPYYMAPEQLAKGPITARTDLFSFAVVLYRMLTGILPFTGDSFAAVAHAILHEKPVPPERLNPGIPRALSNLVLHCLEKSPEGRAGSATEVLRALAAVESGKIEKREAPRTSRRRTLWLSLALLVVALAAIRLNAPQPSAAPIESIEPMAPMEIAPPPLPAPSVNEVEPAPPVQGPETTTPPTSIYATRPPSARTEPPKPSVPAGKEPIEPQSPSLPEAALGEPGKSATEADLFYEARLALEQGELERSRATLETLLSRDPSFTGAGELYAEVTDQIWETRLPLVLGARHKHRLGGCAGELSLASLGVRFQSPAHDMAFRPEDIRVLERPGGTTFIVETFEKDTLSLGKNKRYRFDLETPLSDADWTRYQRLLK
jgi:serine/threonine-protein kinase